MKREKVISILSMSLIAVFSLQTGPGSTTRVETTTYGCVGNLQNSTCNVSVNAIGDLSDWGNLSDVERVDFGMIENRRKFEISFLKNGNKKIYLFTPTQGIFANSAIEILFVSLTLNKKSLSLVPDDEVQELKKIIELNPRAKSLVKIYRKVPGESRWEEIVTIVTQNKDAEKMGTISIESEPDGTIYITQPAMKDSDGTIKEGMVSRIGLGSIAM